MGRQSSDPTVVSSSIALLQERFRELQRVKRRREQRQLMMITKGISDHPNQPNFSNFQPDNNTIADCSSPRDCFLSLGLMTTQPQSLNVAVQADSRVMKEKKKKSNQQNVSGHSHGSSLWPGNTAAINTASAPAVRSLEGTADYVDTSLHL